MRSGLSPQVQRASEGKKTEALVGLPNLAGGVVAPPEVVDEVYALETISTAVLPVGLGDN